MKRTFMLVALLACSFDVFAAQQLLICRPNDIPCDPPAVFVYQGAAVPFNAPVRFGGEVKVKGEKHWLWIKNGEPPTPCTAAQKAERAAYGRACNLPIGEVLYRTRPFLIQSVE